MSNDIEEEASELDQEPDTSSDESFETDSYEELQLPPIIIGQHNSLVVCITGRYQSSTTHVHCVLIDRLSLSVGGTALSYAIVKHAVKL